MHVEQGPELERQGFALGEVTAIAGMAGFAIEFTGEPGHAGTVPMAGRRDALTAAAEFVLRMRAASSRIPGAVSTVGDLRVAEPAANVIPGRVTLTLDLRAPAAEALASSPTTSRRSPPPRPPLPAATPRRRSPGGRRPRR